MKDGQAGEIDGLADLIAPLSLSALVEDYWGKRPLLVKGRPDRFDRLFDLSSWSRALERAKGFDREQVRASFDRGEGYATGMPAMPVPPREADLWFQTGATICITRVHELDDNLSAFLSRVKAELNYPGVVGINCYRSPAGAGFATHYDARVATTLQLSGRKKWRYSKGPAVPWPTDNAKHPAYRAKIRQLAPEEPPTGWAHLDQARYEEVELAPGDLFMLPAGTWHSAEASDGESLALNLWFEPMSYSEIVKAVLQEMEVADPTIRGVRPRPALDGAVQIPPGDTDTFERLEGAIAALRELQRDPVSLARVWTGLALRDAAADEQPEAAPAMLDAAASLRLPGRSRAILSAHRDESGAEHLMITLPGRRGSGGSEFIDIDDPDAVAFVRGAFRRRHFSLRECAGWPELAGAKVDVTQLARELVASGVFEVA